MPGRRVVGLIAWPLLSLVVAVLLGWALGAAVDAWLQPPGSSVADAASGERETDFVSVGLFLAAAILNPLNLTLGAVVGFIVGGLTWITGLIWSAHLLFPDRRRGLPVALTMVVALGGSALTIRAAEEAAGGVPPSGAVWALVLGVFALAGLVFPVWAALAPALRSDAVAQDDAARVPADDVPAADVPAADVPADAPREGTRRLAEWLSRG